MAGNSTPKVYVDSCVFLHVLLSQEHAQDSLRVLTAAERGDIQLIASRLLPVEIAAWRGTTPDQASAESLVERFLDSVGAEWVELDLVSSRYAVDLSWRYRLRSADAVHLATAVRRKADYFMSYDERFPYGEWVEGVEVCKPRIVWNPTIDDGLVVA